LVKLAVNSTVTHTLPSCGYDVRTETADQRDVCGEVAVWATHSLRTDAKGDPTSDEQTDR
jgi:hypothetical protein